MVSRFIVLSFFMLLAFTAQAQLVKKKKKEVAETQQNSPTSLNPYSTQYENAPKHVSKKKRSGGLTYESQKEFEDRMKATVKTKRKNERLMDNPQYSNPMYFGHKRPPKKHKPGKMKLCKECGIRH